MSPEEKAYLNRLSAVLLEGISVAPLTSGEIFELTSAWGLVFALRKRVYAHNDLLCRTPSLTSSVALNLL